jgi:heme exporter protein C
MEAVQPALAGKDSAARSPIALTVLTVMTLLGVAFGLYMALVYAGTDMEQGEVQRIFYIHMPAFIGAAVAFAGTLVGGIQYLRTRNQKWDTLALAGVEVGLTLALVNLVTGSIWARPIWNTWWTWDPRLTSDAVMVLTYAAYLMLRSGLENPEQRHRFAAVYGILAFITVLVTLFIIRVRQDTIHPCTIEPCPTNANAQGAVHMSARMGAALGINMIVWGIMVPVTLLWYRIRLENAAQRVLALKARLLEK